MTGGSLRSGGTAWRRLGPVGAVGVLATALASAILGLPAADAVQLAAIAGAASFLAGGLGAAILRALRGRSIVAQSIVVAMTSLAAVAAAALAAAQAMFLSRHDLSALIVVIFAGGSVGVMAALWLGHRVGEASRAIAGAARRIGEGEWHAVAGRADAAEFAALARELEEMSRRLEETRARERALEASRRELVSWVSHDLRTPMAGIRAMVEALEDGLVTDPDDVARYHRTLRREADRLAALVDDLFELSRISSGALRLQLERASLGDLVSDALAAASPVARAKGVRLEGRLNGPAPELELSPAEIARVLRNLLENAIRHTPSDRAVWVEAGVEDGRAVVTVADACGGIPESDLDRVFDLAFRGESARTHGADGGAGLGLAIARGIVEAHRGEILVRNEGPGCRFTIRLPLSRSA
ncbi:MAG: sensor histidine kinase [Actinomycetota bacterium]